MTPTTPPIDIDELEHLVDVHSLSDLLDALSTVCAEKSEHVLTNWQDLTLASRWNTMALKLDRASAHAKGL